MILWLDIQSSQVGSLNNNSDIISAKHCQFTFWLHFLTSLFENWTDYGIISLLTVSNWWINAALDFRIFKHLAILTMLSVTAKLMAVELKNI